MIYRNLNPRGSRLTGQFFVLSFGTRTTKRAACVYLSFLHQRRMRTGREQQTLPASRQMEPRRETERERQGGRISESLSGRLSLFLSLFSSRWEYLITVFAKRSRERTRREKITRRGPPFSFAELLCVYLVLLIASARSDSTITAEPRSRIYVCSCAPTRPIALVCATFHRRTSARALARNLSL